MTKSLNFINGLLTGTSGSSLNNPSTGARAYTFVNGILTNVGQVLPNITPAQLRMDFNNGLLTGYYIISGSSSGSSMSNIWVLGYDSGTNTLAYSYDGMTWVGQGNSIFSPLGLCSNGFKFIAAGGGSGSNIAYSNNGISWTKITGLNDDWSAVAWNGTRFIAGGAANGNGPYGSNTFADSVDGINWNLQGFTTLSPFCLASNGSMFVAGGNKIPHGWFVPPPGFTSTLAYSYDGLSWTGLGDSAFGFYCYAIATNGSIWVACGGNNNSMAYSYNGIDWTNLGRGIFSNHARGICWNGTMFVAVGWDSVNTIAYSYNGIDWIGLGDPLFANSSGVSGIGVCIGWDGNKFIVGGGSTYPYGELNNMGYSYNGIDWFGLGTSFHCVTVAPSHNPNLIPPV